MGTGPLLAIIGVCSLTADRSCGETDQSNHDSLHAEPVLRLIRRSARRPGSWSATHAMRERMICMSHGLVVGIDREARSHAEMGTSSGRILMHELEYSQTLSALSMSAVQYFPSF
jgi:hypothetical protein